MVELAPDRRRMSYDDYLALERSSETKHEYVNGEVFATAGGTPEHGRLAINLAALLVRGDKWAHYRQLPSLREYVLVSQREPRIEIFRRGPGTSWTFDETRSGLLHLASIDASLDVDAVYRDPLAG